MIMTGHNVSEIENTRGDSEYYISASSALHATGKKKLLINNST